MELTMQQLVARARAHIREVTVEEYEKGRGPDTVLIDVREPEEYGEGHIPGAVNIPRGVIEAEVEPVEEMAGKVAPELHDHNRPIYLYCRSGGRSALAAFALQEMGFTQVFSISGGILAWDQWRRAAWQNA